MPFGVRTALTAFRCGQVHRAASSWAAGKYACAGLLKDATDTRWSNNLNLEDAVSLMNKRGMLWEALTLDAAGEADASSATIRGRRGQSRSLF
jgi:hypothetical protein